MLASIFEMIGSSFFKEKIWRLFRVTIIYYTPSFTNTTCKRQEKIKMFQQHSTSFFIPFSMALVVMKLMQIKTENRSKKEKNDVGGIITNYFPPTSVSASKHSVLFQFSSSFLLWRIFVCLNLTKRTWNPF